MKQYEVSIPYLIWVEVIVDAEDEDSALDEAYLHSDICHYIGNGGRNKLVGVKGSSHASLYLPGGPYEGEDVSVIGIDDND